MKKLALFSVLIILILVQVACRTLAGESEPAAPSMAEVEASSTPTVDLTEPTPTEKPPESTNTPTEAIERTEVPPEPTICLPFRI